MTKPSHIHDQLKRIQSGQAELQSDLSDAALFARSIAHNAEIAAKRTYETEEDKFAAALKHRISGYHRAASYLQVYDAKTNKRIDEIFEADLVMGILERSRMAGGGKERRQFYLRHAITGEKWYSA